jgi:hypothetical protein
MSMSVSYPGVLEVDVVAFFDTVLSHRIPVQLVQAKVPRMFFTPCLDAVAHLPFV